MVSIDLVDLVALLLEKRSVVAADSFKDLTVLLC